MCYNSLNNFSFHYFMYKNIQFNMRYLYLAKMILAYNIQIYAKSILLLLCIVNINYFHINYDSRIPKNQNFSRKIEEKI